MITLKPMEHKNLKPNTSWSLENSLYVFNILNAIRPKMEIEDTENYENESLYILKTISRHLEKNQIPFELKDLWHIKRNKRLCVLLDCGGIMWSIIGSRGIEESLRFLKCGIDNVELREFRSRSVLTCINSTSNILDHMQKSNCNIEDILYFSLSWTPKHKKQITLDFSLAIEPDLFVYLEDFKKHLHNYETEGIKEHNIEKLELKVYQLDELPPVDNFWLDDFKTNETPSHRFVFYKDEIKSKNIKNIYNRIGQLPLHFKTIEDEQQFIHELGANLYCLKTKKKRNDYQTDLSVFSIACSCLTLTQSQHQANIYDLWSFLDKFHTEGNLVVRELPIIEQIGKFINHKIISKSLNLSQQNKDFRKKERF